MFNHEERIAVLERIVAVDSALKCLIAEYPAAALRITLMLLPDTTEPE